MSVPTLPAGRTATRRAPQPVPIYFGPGETLFGVFHPPQKQPARGSAIVLCHPAGHEYLRVHRSFRNLAVALSRLGFPVLRFDYAGTGDSAGEGGDASLETAQRDLDCAIAEVRRRSGLSSVGLAGLRLGGTIAWLRAAAGGDVDVVQLWEPVLRGAAYAEQLRALEHAWRSEPARKGASLADPGLRLGFPFSAAMERQLAPLDLTAVSFPSTGWAFAIVGEGQEEASGWCQRFRARYGEKSCVAMPPIDWTSPDTIHTAVYPQAAQQVIAQVFAQVLP